jgi:deazaflavin-dependent oxidoreductase (nitroreductase family)
MAAQIVDSLRASDEIELTVKGRKSGALIPRPVWFALSKDERSLFLVPAQGRKTQWYLNVKKDPAITIRVQGATFKGEAVELPMGRFGDVLAAFVVKYGKADIGRYYPRRGADEAAFEVRLPPPE